MNEADQAFGSSYPDNPPPQPPAGPPPGELRRLYREPEDKRIAGVCAGLADYFGIDPTIVRLATILLTVMAGVAPVAYVIAAVVVPERPPTVPRRTAPPEQTEVWSTGTKVLVVVMAVALLAFGDLGWWFNMPTIAIVLVLVGVWLLVVDRDSDRPGPLSAGSPHDPLPGGEKTPSFTNAWSAEATTLATDRTSDGAGASGLGEATLVEPPGAVGDRASDDDPATGFAGAASDDSAVSAGPQGEVPPPVPPWGVGSPAYVPQHPAPADGTPRRGGAGLPLGVIAALLIGAGVVSLLGVFDVGDLSPLDVMAGAVLLIGTAMVLGAWWGNARPLIALGLPAVGLLLLADSVEVPLDAGAGDRTRVVDSAADLDQTYQLTAGELTLDLTDLPVGPRSRSAPPTLKAEVAFGQLVVIVPRDANVEVDAKAFIGDVVGDPDGGDDGVDVRERFDLDGDEGGGRLLLDLEVGFGEIVVRRA